MRCGVESGALRQSLGPTNQGTAAPGVGRRTQRHRLGARVVLRDEVVERAVDVVSHGAAALAVERRLDDAVTTGRQTPGTANAHETSTGERQLSRREVLDVG